MAVHQYIGARYVPYYYQNSLDPTSTEWEPNVEYEALTVVTLPNNHSYISKKTVPDSIGSPAQNAEYWLDTGSEDAYIQNLQDQIDIINNTDLPAITSDIADMQNDINDLKTGADKRIVCVTDSYGTHSVTNWANRTFTNIGVDPATDGFVFAEGSSGFSHQGQSGHNFEELLTANIANVTDPDTITDVIFGGGTNDFYYYTNKAALVSAIASAIAYAKTQFPNARIWVCFMGYFAWMLPTMRQSYYDTIAIYASCSLINGAKFINAYWPMHNYFFRDDSQHPNEYGNQAIAEIVSANLIGCNAPMPLTTPAYGLNVNNVAVTPDPQFDSTGGTWQLHMGIKGDDALITTEEFSMVKTGGMTLTPGTNISVGTYSLDTLPIISANDFVHLIPLSIISGGSNILTFARISFIDSGTSGVGKIVINPVVGIAGVTFIQIKNNTMVVPLVCA